MYIKTINKTTPTNLHYAGDLLAGQPFRYPQDEENNLYMLIELPTLVAKLPENHIYCINLNAMEIELISLKDTVIPVEILKAKIEFCDITESEG